MSTYIDIHIIQNLPPSCVNRDDSGSPKSAVYGGVRRLRVSSQSWKRATRLYFNDLLDADDVGVRTKRVVEVLAAAIAKDAPELAENATTLAEGVFKAAKIKLSPPRGKKDGTQESGYLLFLSTSQIARLAELAIAPARSGETLDAKTVKKIFKEAHAVDIALFGRMVADDTDLNVDAACQVAHAISTHAAENEYDFFTAVDDDKSRSEEEDAGAGMMGTVEFSSATMYRYATVNLDMLVENLGDGDAAGRGGGKGRLVPFGVGVAFQDEHDVRVPDVLDRGQLLAGHDPDAFVVLAETLGQDEGPLEAGQGIGQLREGFARVGHDRDLRVAARRGNGGFDGTTVRGDRDGVVPGQPDAGERLGHR